MLSTTTSIPVSTERSGSFNSATGKKKLNLEKLSYPEVPCDLNYYPSYCTQVG